MATTYVPLVLGDILSWLPSIILVYVCCSGVYKAVFHPFAKYPGPVLAKFTNLYAAYHGLRGDIHLDVLRCHRRYGKFVRYGPDRLVIDSADGFHEIYGHQANVRKATAYLPMANNGTWTTMTTIDKSYHLKKRKLVSMMLTGDSLRTSEQQISRHLGNTFEALFPPRCSKEWSQPLPMHDVLQELMTDAISELLFGRPIGPEHVKMVVESLRLYNWRKGVHIQIPWIRKWKLKQIEYYIGYKQKLRDSFSDWSDEFGEKVVRDKEGVFSIYQGDSKEDVQFPRKEIWAEAFLLTWAGSDTSSTVMSALLFYLSRNREQYDKITAEVRSSFRSQSSICSGIELNACSYLSACIQETLRVSPPTSGVPWREVEAGGGFFEGQYIPEGMDVGTCIYSLHHNEEYFVEPHRFIPERWLGDQLSKASQKASNAFSIGPRGCIGKPMAMLQISIIAARIIWEFDFKAANGELAHVGEGRPGLGAMRRNEDEYQLNSNVTSQGEGPFLVFKRREDLS